jgi:hypothetical protein
MLSLSSRVTSGNVVRIPQTIWKQAAVRHQQHIKELLLPTLLPDEDYKPFRQQRRTQDQNIQKKRGALQGSDAHSRNDDVDDDWMRPLDPKNPVCNFLIEYYGLKGHKGTKRLARWSPSPNLLLQSDRTYSSLEGLLEASCRRPPSFSSDASPEKEPAIGVFLEDVQPEDFGTLLHLRGAILESDGALYSPSLWFDAKKTQEQVDSKAKHPASAFLWFRSILQQTLQAEPILHCHGLHEWAMVYHPEGAQAPPSAKYQSHLQLRVDQHTINFAVERKGISCTHVDALRFFAPAAGPLNHHGSSLERTDQLRLEQPACVHAHMDLLKIGLRLQPFCDSQLMQKILQLSMDARRLDVAASPYDATDYGIDIVPIETKEGRAIYRKEQRQLMERAEPIRRELLASYDLLLKMAFDEDPLTLESQVEPSAERFAVAQPGGKPWRQNLIPSS